MITQQQRDLRNAVIKLLRDNLTDEPHEHVDALILVFGSVIEKAHARAHLKRP